MLDILRAVWRRLRLVVRLERRSPLAFARPDLLLRGFLSDRAYLYPEAPSRKRGYISDYAIELRLGSVNPDSARHAVDDKAMFAERLVAADLGAHAPVTYGLIREGRPSLAVAPETIDQTGAILKPLRGVQGRGVIRVESMAEILALGLGGHLVQEPVRQAGYADRIWPGSLNTMRVLGLRDAEGAFVGPAAHRFGSSTTGLVDNFSAGGLIAGITPDGVLTPLVEKPTRRQRVTHVCHPETGGEVVGVQVPFWEETRALVVQLMEAFPELLHVGWDIAITDAGPTVIEGNGGVANLNIFQAHGPVLTSDRLVQFYRDVGVLRR